MSLRAWTTLAEPISTTVLGCFSPPQQLQAFVQHQQLGFSLDRQIGHPLLPDLHFLQFLRLADQLITGSGIGTLCGFEPRIQLGLSFISS
jgi:hypothetical protein